MWTFICVVLFSIHLSTCKPSYRDYIPNGYIVPNPCVYPSVWDAVGHYLPIHHTIVKNQFGWDFIAAGLSWTATLCNKDSDGDGKKNGEELGDPDCTWQEGAPAPRPPIGHPGICEPVGSPRCFSRQGFKCDCMNNCPNLKP